MALILGYMDHQMSDFQSVAEREKDKENAVSEDKSFTNRRGKPIISL